MIVLRKVPEKSYDKGEQFGDIFSFKLLKFEFDIRTWKHSWSITWSLENLYELEFINKDGLEDYKKMEADSDWFTTLFKIGKE